MWVPCNLIVVCICCCLCIFCFCTSENRQVLIQTVLLLIHYAVYIRGRGAVHFDMCIVHCAFVFVKPLHIWSGMREGDVRRSVTFRLLNLMALIYPELILARRPWFESEGPKADIFASFASLRLPGRLQALFLCINLKQVWDCQDLDLKVFWIVLPLVRS